MEQIPTTTFPLKLSINPWVPLVDNNLPLRAALTFSLLFILDCDHNVVEKASARRSECVEVTGFIFMFVVDSYAHVFGFEESWSWT